VGVVSGVSYKIPKRYHDYLLLCSSSNNNKKINKKMRVIAINKKS
jgi:hypothetical protein